MAFDLATAQHVQALEAKVDQLLTLLAKPATSAEPLMTVDEVADYTRFDRRTVETWVSAGRHNDQGKLVYLPALDFSGRLRFKRADVEAFGLKVGVLTSSRAAGGPPEPTKKPKNSKTPVASEKALRRVA